MSVVSIAQTTPIDKCSSFFWIKRDRSAFARCVLGSTTVAVRLDHHAAVLSSECEDWCLDNLTDGLLMEWRGIELRAHFANKQDAIMFKLRWL